MKRTFTILLLLMALHTVAMAQNEELLQAEKNRFDLMVKKDVAALKELLSDDLIYTHSTGAVDGKEKILASIEAGTYQSIDVLEQKPVSWGNTGVISGKIRAVIHNQSGDRTIVLRYTDVYRKQGKAWKLVAWQSLLVDN